MKMSGFLSNKKQGFTLIELLLVIVIIGILAGIVLAIINPAKQQRKAKESILKANANKVCLALFACSSTAGDVTSCDTFAGNEVAAAVDTLRGTPNNFTLTGAAANANAVPAYATYTMTIATNLVTITGSLPGGNATGGNGAATATNACSYVCSYNFNTGVATPIRPLVVANCL